MFLIDRELLWSVIILLWKNIIFYYLSSIPTVWYKYKISYWEGKLSLLSVFLKTIPRFLTIEENLKEIIGQRAIW